jgi:hypothetical protein
LTLPMLHALTHPSSLALTAALGKCNAYGEKHCH